MEKALSKLRESVSLKPYNSFALDATAHRMYSIRDEQEALWVLEHGREEGRDFFVLGGGSNLLLTEDLEETVLKVEIPGIELIEEDEKRVLLRVGAGENWHGFVQHCIGKDWGGVENLSLIPGLVGAAPIQNIGAYGVEFSSVFEDLEAIEIESGTSIRLPAEACDLGYRDSIFKREAKGKYLITRVWIRLSKAPHHRLVTSYRPVREALEQQNIARPGIADLSRIITDIRRSKLPDPEEIGNAGSFFKNPVIPETIFLAIKADFPDIPSYPAESGNVKIPAAWLIEQCGWKGKSLGGAMVHEKQALVLVNPGRASGQEILALSERIQGDVHQRFGITLCPEVNIIKSASSKSAT